MKNSCSLIRLNMICRKISVIVASFGLTILILVGCGSTEYSDDVRTVDYSDSSFELSIDEIIDNKYVVQIPEFSSVSQSEAIDDINQDIDSLLVSMYQSDMESGDKIPEIKTILYENDKYLQALVMYVEYPLLGSNGDVVSYNYVRDEDRRVTLSDALIMSGTTLDDLKNTIIDVYYKMKQAEVVDYEVFFESVFGVTVDGYIINDDGSIDFYGNIDISVNENDPWSYIFKYNTISGVLETL